jgi:hypothetical protein
MLTIRKHLGSHPIFGGIRVAHLFSLFVFCCVFVFYKPSTCVLCPMLPVSLDCLCLVSCNQCCQCRWIVVVFCLVSNVASVSEFSLSCVQCCQCLWIVLCLVSNVVSVSGLSSSCVLCPMLPVSLDCLCLVSCVQCC